MASYTELRQLFSNDGLRNRTEVAVVIAANAIAQNSTAETAARIAWAKAALGATGPEADKALKIALAINSTLDSATILAAGDGALQTAVNSALPVLASTS